MSEACSGSYDTLAVVGCNEVIFFRIILASTFLECLGKRQKRTTLLKFMLSLVWGSSGHRWERMSIVLGRLHKTRHMPMSPVVSTMCPT